MFLDLGRTFGRMKSFRSKSFAVMRVVLMKASSAGFSGPAFSFEQVSQNCDEKYTSVCHEKEL